MDKQASSKNSLLDIMPGKRRPTHESGAASAPAATTTRSGSETYINSETVIEGKILAQGELCVDGSFKGEIISNHHVVVGNAGKVEGTVEAKSMVVCGQVIGNLKILERLELQATGELIGDLETQPGALVIEKGARLDGRCSMGLSGNAPRSGQQPQQVAPQAQPQLQKSGRPNGRSNGRPNGRANSKPKK